MRIKQDDKYQGDDWWAWAVWIDGTAEEIRSIEAVTYTLHPTFHNPVRRVTDRKSKFRLESEGWGTFTIFIRVDLKDGKKRNFKHDLALHYPDGKKTESVQISIGNVKQGDALRHVETLKGAILRSAPDATVERGVVMSKDEDAPATLRVQLNSAALLPIAKGIQSWLTVNPGVKLDLSQQGLPIAVDINAGNVLKILRSLKD
jgi:hypothetical protein